MYQKTEFTFPSTSGMCDIHAAKYIPQGEVRAVLQIAHGMAEHFERYEKFIGVLCDNGIAVFTNDHLGHGKSVAKPEDKGYFGPGGWHVMVADCHELYGIARKEFPTQPYYFFGHSMGSFVARAYTREYGQDLAGAIYCGTGGKNPALGMGIALSKMIASCKGDRHKSKLIDGMAFGAYNKKFEKRTNFDWLTRDHDVVDAYIADPDCGFLFTVNGMLGLFGVLQSVSGPDWYNSLPKDLPILLIAGDMDPVGNYGKGVSQVCDDLKAAGRNVEMILYKDCRHEILNESAVFDTVCKDVLEFIG